MRGGLIAVAVCAAATSHAAELRWSSTEDCASAAQFVEQVEGQVGTSLATIEGIDFEVAVTREAGDLWRLTLVSIEHPA